MHSHDLIDAAAAAVLVIAGLVFVTSSIWAFHRAGSATATEPAHPAPASRDVDIQRAAILIAAALSFGAAVIHFAAVGPHLEEFAPYAYAFAALGVIQLVLGAGLVRGWPLSRQLNVAVNLAVIAVWVISRTIGLPFGPEPWQPEEIGAADVIASAFEAALVLLLLVAPSLTTWSTTRLARARDQAYMALVPITGLIVVVTLIAVAALNGDTETHLH